MKLLIVSHACATPVNQQLFAAIEDLTRWSLTLVGPSNWRDSYGATRQLERWPSFDGALRAVPTLLSGHIPLHVYRTTFLGLLRDEDPDAIFVHHEPYAAATAQIYLANAWSIDRPIGFFTWQNIQKTYPLPFRWMEQFVYSRSDFAFPGSESAEKVLRTKGYTGPTAILPATVDPTVYAPHPDAHALRSELQQGDDDLLIGYVGRLTEAKGLRTLMDGLAQIEDSVPWRLVLVGRGDAEDDLREYAAQRRIDDRVTFCGYVPHTDAPRYLSAFDMLVLPSETQANWREQFGRVLIESLACGTPIIGSDSGEIPHVIENTGGGRVFPEGNSAALAATIRELAEQPATRRSLAERGRQTVLNTYTTQSSAETFASTVDSVVSRTQDQRAKQPVGG